MLFLLLAALFYTALWYVLSRVLARMDIMDTAWGLGFVVLSFLYHLCVAPLPLLFLALLAAHQLRLCVHIGLRTFRKKTEDRRYSAWRESWGATVWWRSYLQVFFLQGVIMAFVLGALIVPAPLTLSPFVVAMGLALWAYGMVYEVVGDSQLARFKASPENKGKTLCTGLWARTRHPNYWGECCIWWGYFFLLGLPALGLFAPAAMTYLLTKVSGVAMAERIAKKTPEREAYEKKVPPFAPTNHFL